MIGFDIMKGIEFPWPVATMILQHHERINGSGYPHGLGKSELLLESRILCVADVIEAMSSNRPYRPALGLDLALEEICKNKNILYDGDVVDACLEFYHSKGYKAQ
jgi:HD-GYP domain-containing protein (c-di-GMP phosphodiesterase class II)